MQLFTNNAVSSLASGVNATDNTLVLVAGDGAKFPAITGGDFFLLTLTQGVGLESSWEIVKCTARSGDSLTVVRAQEGTAGQVWAAGSKVDLRVTAGTLEAKEPSITSGTTAQYWRGDKTWRDFATDVRATVLTGLSTATNAVITASDTVLTMAGKLQKQISDHLAAASGAHAATAISNTPSGSIAATTVQAALNELGSEKQATLVSGTNIKTVNGATLLGSGNVDVGGAVNGILKSNGSGVYSSAVAGTDFQAPLVSGTNIKTVNGSSLLGSGNLLVGEASAIAITYNANGSVNTVTEDGVVKTLAYNSDNKINTISWPVTGGKTRTETYSYTSDVLTGMTTTEA